MKTWKLAGIAFVLLVVMSAVLYKYGDEAISFSIESKSSPSTPVTIKPENISGTPDEKVQQIAQVITAEYAGKLLVSYAENPEHYTADGRLHYGSHYIIFILPQAEPTPEISEQTWKTAVGRVYQLTYEHILRDDPDFTHAGVQVVEPDAWLIGGHSRGSIVMFEAAEEALARTPSPKDPFSWTFGATEQELNGTNFYALLVELERLQKLTKGS